jgi:hypothetical protein
MAAETRRSWLRELIVCALVAGIVLCTYAISRLDAARRLGDRLLDLLDLDAPLTPAQVNPGGDQPARTTGTPRTLRTTASPEGPAVPAQRSAPPDRATQSAPTFPLRR